MQVMVRLQLQAMLSINVVDEFLHICLVRLVWLPDGCFLMDTYGLIC